MKRLIRMVTVVLIAVLCTMAAAETTMPWASAELVYIGEMRGNRFIAVSYSDGENEYNGILDAVQGGYAVEPSSAIAVCEGQGEDDVSFQYYGGKDTGVYWVEDCEADRIAFLDVQSGYFSGFRFSIWTDPWFVDPKTDYLRVGKDDQTYAYINRRNGEFLTDYLFQQMNQVGFVGPFAVEQLAASGVWVIVYKNGFLRTLPDGCEPVDWYDHLKEDRQSGKILLRREDGSTFLFEPEAPLDPQEPFDYDTREYEVSEEELTALAARDFPEWTVAEDSRYWTGRWHNQFACYQEIQLYRVEENTLLQRRLSVLVNPLRQGENVPWEIEDWAPLPLTPEAMRTFLSLNLDEYRYSFIPGSIESGKVPEPVLSGCAPFLLEEGETWTQLMAYPDYLSGIVRRTAGRYCVRIAHWDGERFDRVISSRFHPNSLSIGESYSWNDTLCVNLFQFVCQEDGRWLFVHVSDGDPTCYTISEGFIDDTIYPYDSNDAMHYGIPTFERDLTRVDFAAIPEYIMDAVSLLDSSAFACVRADNTPMLDAPDGETMALCFARLAGTVLQRENGWVQLQIGSEEKGLAGWFAEDDLAFGPEIEEILCGFPSHSEDDCDGDYLLTVLKGADPADYLEYMSYVWLIGRLSDGSWLVQLNVDTVCTAAAGAFRDIGSATDYRTEAQEIYDEYEQERLMQAAGAEQENGDE